MPQAVLYARATGNLVAHPEPFGQNVFECPIELGRPLRRHTTDCRRLEQGMRGDRAGWDAPGTPSPRPDTSQHHPQYRETVPAFTFESPDRAGPGGRPN
ncbi:hypothetical protein NRB56_54560 [Nocardia sp. RB56]|uniref:Uncharacterized protein n=1 Tax=Nocardia aurantia TaxID=2585199 RepID=A0A7K0DX21_9NOCA|nr:hypothetical protein [Nocardia aurantia]